LDYILRIKPNANNITILDDIILAFNTNESKMGDKNAQESVNQVLNDTKLQDSYIQANQYGERLKTIEEWEIFDDGSEN
jgi:hypothetical protein